MTPEAQRFLLKASRLLEEAQSMQNIGLFDAAGRAAYLAAFHAAQALIFERYGKITKSHGGVHAEFQRIAKGCGRLDPELRTFLSRAYNLKAAADYGTDPDRDVSPERASEAVRTAVLFVTRVAGLFDSSEP